MYPYSTPLPESSNIAPHDQITTKGNFVWSQNEITTLAGQDSDMLPEYAHMNVSQNVSFYIVKVLMHTFPTQPTFPMTDNIIAKAFIYEFCHMATQNQSEIPN